MYFHKSFRRFLSTNYLTKLEPQQLIAAELIASGLKSLIVHSSVLLHLHLHTHHMNSGLQLRSVRGELSTRQHCQSSRDSMQGSAELPKLNKMLRYESKQKTS
jgi:hypothetical protein